MQLRWHLICFRLLLLFISCRFTVGISLQNSSPSSRRSWFSSSLAFVCGSSISNLASPTIAEAAPATASTATGSSYATSDGRGPNCITRTDPSRTVVTCPPRLRSSTGSLASIAATENGVSTSAIRNPSAYVAPWNYSTETSDPAVAWASLVEVINAMPGLISLEQRQEEQQYYLHAIVASRNNNDFLDDVECVLRPEDRLVLFRSASRTSVFVYPLTQPVSDGQINRKRMEKVRQTLGWAELI